MIAPIAMAVACTKTEVKDVVQPGPSDGDSSPVAVQFGLSDPQPTVITKGTGMVGGMTEDANHWAGQTVYVFGYDRSVSDFTSGEESAFIWNIKAVANAGSQSGEAVLDVYNPDPSGTGTPDPSSTEPFFYKGDTVYDFYGYHIDDAYAGAAQEVTPVAEADRIYVPFEIDGSQDLMVAVADPSEDIKGSEVNNPANAYSAYAARRGVQPTLSFKHQLARFTFSVKAGSQSANTIQVDSIKLESRYKGSLTVVGKDDNVPGISDTTATDAKKWLELREKPADGSTLTGLTAEKLEPYNEDTPAEPQSLGESIMAIPGVAEYNLRVVLSDTRDDVETAPEPQLLKLKASELTGAGSGATKFEAGKSYQITVIVYGLEDIRISASLQAWQDGGSAEVGNDEPPAGNDDPVSDDSQTGN